MIQLYINGPPGSGKTTICKILSDEFLLEHVSTGDLLRENIVLKTELGRKAKECITTKTLVPDEVVVGMVAEKILECNKSGKGWVLDGFPRTTEQSAALKKKQIFPCVVLILELPENQIMKRITGRRFDPVTGNIYHQPNNVPKDAVVAARLTKRSDDIAEKVPARIEAYRTHGKETNGLYDTVAYKIDAHCPLEEVINEIKEIILSIRPALEKVVKSNKNKNKSTNQSQPKSRCFERVDEEEEEQVEMEKDDDEPQQNKSIILQMENDISRMEQQFKNKSISVKSTAAALFSKPTNKSSNNEEEIQQSSSQQSNKEENNVPNTEEEEEEEQSKPKITSLSIATATAGSIDLEKFKKMLIDGFDVVKHGRRGSPHSRTIFCDIELKRIFWQKPGGKELKAKIDQSIAMIDIIQVVRGIKSDVLKRTGEVSKYEKYLSLVADDRTLDIEVSSSAMCEFLFKGFQRLIHNEH
jgi:adenylate kinase